MPGFSSLTNSALVDALLSPSGNESRQQEQEQENERNALLASTRTPKVLDVGKNRTHPADAALEEPPQLPGCDSSNARGQPAQESLGRRPRKQLKRKSASFAEVDGEYVDDYTDHCETPPPTRKSRRSTRVKKSPAPAKSLSAEDGQAVPSPQKTAKKARPSRLIRKKPIGISVPKTLSEAGPADRMMWEWKNAGKNWEEIRTEWKKITGIEPGGSSLSVRYIKLVENLARNGAAGDLDLLRFKKEAETELMDQLWPKVAEKMLAHSPESEHNPKDLQKRYNMIVRSGYDVEKLLADDQMRLVAEQRICEPHGDSGKPAASPPNGSSTGTGEYDSAIANSAAASLDQPSTQAPRQQQYLGDHEDQNDISADPTNIFENIGLLHEVDGLNESGEFADIKYPISVPPEIGSFMSDDTMLSHSPLGTHERMLKHLLDGRMPLTGSLVSYHSDSE